MNEQDSRAFLADIVASALEGRLGFIEICRLIPTERRREAVEALKGLGYREAATTLESLTGEQGLGRLWD